MRHAAARLRAEAELACDDWAVRRGVEPLDLANCLASVAAWGIPQAASSPAMIDGESALVLRVRRLIARERSGASTSWTLFASALLLIGALGLACGEPGVSSRSEVEPETGTEDPVLVIQAFEDGSYLIGEERFEMPAEVERLQDRLAELAAASEQAPASDEPDAPVLPSLRVVLHGPDELYFARMQEVMAHLARARLWQIQLASADHEAIPVPLPFDQGPPDVEVSWREKAEILITVAQEQPRRLSYRLGPDRKMVELPELVEHLENWDPGHPLEEMIIDARRGVLYREMIALLGALLGADLPDVDITFVGSYEK